MRRPRGSHRSADAKKAIFQQVVGIRVHAQGARPRTICKGFAAVFSPVNESSIRAADNEAQVAKNFFCGPSCHDSERML